MGLIVMTQLSVNLNKIALLRNSRGGDYPNCLSFARRCIACGANGVTVHPRPDQRHTRYSDVRDLSAFVNNQTKVEFNIEGNPTPEFLEVVKEVKPNQCTLVPDSPDQITSDHGWDLKSNANRLIPIIQSLKAHNIRVSIFMDPDVSEIERAPDVGTDRIELYTESYARAFETDDRIPIFNQFQRATESAQSLGLGVNAGHDLNQRNLPLFLTIPGILEVSIGHAIIIESLDQGFDSTVRRYRRIMKGS